jgi:nucleotide-binding universal stress UspA family protein
VPGVPAPQDQLCPVCNPAEAGVPRYKLERLVVAVSPTEDGLPLAAAHARALAQSANAEILLVSAVAESGRTEPLAAAQSRLDRLAASMRDWGATVTATAVRGKPPHAAVLAAAREWRADLVVVGTHESRTSGPHFGRMARQLLRFADCPLLLVKDPAFDGYRTILAAVDPFDGSEALGANILDVARAVGAGLGSELRIVAAYAKEAPLLPVSAEVEPGVFLDARALARMERLAVERLARDHDVAADAIDLRAGAPHEVIQAVAELRGAEVVVLGARSRRHPLTATLRGTVDAVAETSSCDVLLVPAPIV